MSGENFERNTNAAGVFTDYFFPCMQESILYKEGKKAFPNTALFQFTPLSFSFTIIPDVRNEYLEKEYIIAFFMSAKHLASIIYDADEAVNGSTLFKTYSLVIPVLYLTRHCMELMMKKIIREFGGNVEKIHKLKRLWCQLEEFLRKRTLNKRDEQVIDYMREFVLYVDILDENGTRFRYSTTNKGKPSFDGFYWVNCNAVVFYLECFLQQLSCLIKENN